MFLTGGIYNFNWSLKISNPESKEVLLNVGLYNLTIDNFIEPTPVQSLVVSELYETLSANSLINVTENTTVALIITPIDTGLELLGGYINIFKVP